jgi:hypothetical protein
MDGHDVLVPESPGHLDLLYEKHLTFLGAQEKGIHEFEGHFFLHELVMRSVHDPHSPFANLFLDLVSVGDSVTMLKA